MCIRDSAVYNQMSHIQFMEMNFLTSVPNGTYDLLVSNPPYIPEEEMDEIMVEVRNYEPKLALTDQHDGLSFYHRIASEAKSLIKPEGWIVLEEGIGTHPDKLKKNIQNAELHQFQILQDFNNDERVLKIQI